MRVPVQSILVVVLLIIAHTAFAQNPRLRWEQRSTGDYPRNPAQWIEAPNDGSFVIGYAGGYRRWISASGQYTTGFGANSLPAPFIPHDVSTTGSNIVGLRTGSSGTEVTVLQTSTGTTRARRVGVIPTSIRMSEPAGDHVFVSTNGATTILSMPSLQVVGTYYIYSEGSSTIAPDNQSQIHIVEGNVQRFDLMTGESIRKYSGASGVVQTSYAMGSSKIVGYTRNTIALWDAASGDRRQLFSDGMERLVMRNGGRYAVTMSMSGVRGDSTIRVWDLEIEGRIHDYRGHGIEFPISAATITPDESHLAIVDQSGSIVLMDLATGAIDRRIGSAHGTSSVSVAVNNQGTIVASGSTNIELHDASTGETRGEFRFDDALIFGLSFSNDGDHLAATAVSASGTGTAGGVYICSMADRNDVRNISPEPMYDVAYSPDGTMIAACGNNGGVSLWNSDGTFLRQFPEHTGFVYSVAFSPDGEMLVTASQDRTVKVWDVSTGARLRSFSGNLDEVHDATFTASGTSVVSCAKDGRVFVFSMNGGRRELEVAPSTPLYRVATSTNPNIIFAGGTNLYAYDLRSGRVVHTYVDLDRLKTDYYLVANDPRSGRLVTVSGDGDVLSWNQPATVGVEREIETTSGLLSPNPANDRATIRPQLDHPSDVSATVFDALGRSVLNTPSRRMISGESLEIDVSSLAPGAYHVTMIVDGRAQHLPLVVAR